MTLSQIAIYRSLRIAGLLLIFGLLVEVASLIWSKPLSFLLFVGVAGLATILGLCVYLYSLLPATESTGASMKKN
jgi:hypothetical protein